MDQTPPAPETTDAQAWSDEAVAEAYGMFWAAARFSSEAGSLMHAAKVVPDALMTSYKRSRWRQLRLMDAYLDVRHGRTPRRSLAQMRTMLAKMEKESQIQPTMVLPPSGPRRWDYSLKINGQQEHLPVTIFAFETREAALVGALAETQAALHRRLARVRGESPGHTILIETYSSYDSDLGLPAAAVLTPEAVR